MGYTLFWFVPCLVSCFDLHLMSWLVSRSRMSVGVEKGEDVAQNVSARICKRFQDMA